MDEIDLDLSSLDLKTIDLDSGNTNKINSNSLNISDNSQPNLSISQVIYYQVQKILILI